MTNMAVFFLFSTKNLSSVVKMMMTVSKQRAGGGVPDMDDKQSLIDDIETGDWCLSLIWCYNVVSTIIFIWRFLSSTPLPQKRKGLDYCATLPSICLIYTRLNLTNIILHEKSIDKKFLLNCFIWNYNFTWISCKNFHTIIWYENTLCQIIQTHIIFTWKFRMNFLWIFLQEIHGSAF